MQEQFVTYEIALAIKELGFDERCFGWYDKDKRFFFPANNTLHTKNSKVEKLSIIAAPLWQQIIDWFRKKYDIHISIEPLHRPKRFNKLMYCFCISCKDNYYGGMDDNLDAWLGLSDDGVNYHICENYNEAREQAILNAIELCKNN